MGGTVVDASLRADRLASLEYVEPQVDAKTPSSVAAMTRPPRRPGERRRSPRSMLTREEPAPAGRSAARSTVEFDTSSGADDDARRTDDRDGRPGRADGRRALADVRIRPRADARRPSELPAPPAVPPDLEVPGRQPDRVPADRRLRAASTSRRSEGTSGRVDAETGEAGLASLVPRPLPGRVADRRATGSSTSRSSEVAARTGAGPGMVVAIDAHTGKDVWRVPRPAERVDGARRGRHRLLRLLGSPPLRARTRRPASCAGRFEADDELNGAPAYADDTVYVGSDGGRLFAVAARSGQAALAGGGAPRGSTSMRRRRSRTAASSSGTRTAPSTPSARRPATSSGRSGRARTSTRRRPSGTRRVYVGSYDGNVYALDAATGDVRWRYDSPGAIHGAPTVLAGLVYFANCGHVRHERDRATPSRGRARPSP